MSTVLEDSEAGRLDSEALFSAFPPGCPVNAKTKELLYINKRMNIISIMHIIPLTE